MENKGAVQTVPSLDMMHILVIGFPRTCTTIVYKCLAYLLDGHVRYRIYEPTNIDVWIALLRRGYVMHDTCGHVPCDNTLLPMWRTIMKIALLVAERPRSALSHVVDMWHNVLMCRSPILVKDVYSCMLLRSLAEHERARIIVTVREPRSLVRAFVREWLTDLYTGERARRLVNYARSRLRAVLQGSPMKIVRFIKWAITYMTLQDSSARTCHGLRLLQELYDMSALDSDPLRLLLRLYGRYLEEVRKVEHYSNVKVLYFSDYVSYIDIARTVKQWI